MRSNKMDMDEKKDQAKRESIEIFRAASSDKEKRKKEEPRGETNEALV